LKALVLAAGEGRRAESFRGDLHKTLIDVRGGKLIDFPLGYAAGVADEIIMVVGHKKEQLISYIGGEWRGVPVSYVVQEKQIGLVDAMLCAREKIGGDSFFLFLGDEVLDGGRHREMLELFERTGALSVVGLVREKSKERISRTYSVEMDEDGRVVATTEKPRIESIGSDWMGTGNCVFGGGFFEYVDRIGDIAEVSFPDILEYAIRDGADVYGIEIGSRYYNLNAPVDFDELMSEAG
jgi:NDP-sugar pyrophosphorylase family protein